MQREDGQRFVQPFSDAAGGAGIFVPQALGEIREEPRRRLHVARLRGTPHDRLDPRALSLRQVVEDVAERVDLAPLNEGGLAEARAHRFMQRQGAIEDHEQAAVRAQAAALEIRQSALPHGRVLGRALSQAQRVFLAIRRDPEGHHEAVLPDVHAVEEQRHKGAVVQRRRLPRPELHRGLRPEPSADAAFARAAAHHAGRQGLQTPRILAGRDAHQHVLDDAPIQRVGVRQGLERRQRDRTPVGADPRPRDSHLAPAQHDFAGHRARAG